MATAFDGLGMQFLGKERQHMASGPFGDLAKMIAPGALAYGLYKSGAVDSLNSAFNPKEALMGYMKGQGVAPDQKTDIGVAPVQSGPMSVPSLTMINDAREALDAMPEQSGNQGVVPFQFQPPARTIDNDLNDVIPLQSVSADPFKRDVSQDMAALQTTQVQAPPPSNVGQGQMGKDAKNDGGVDMASIVKLLMAFV